MTDHELLDEVAPIIHKLGFERASKIAGVSPGTLAQYAHGYRPSFVKGQTREGLLRLVHADHNVPEDGVSTADLGRMADALGRMADALETAATALMLALEEWRPRDSE